MVDAPSPPANGARAVPQPSSQGGAHGSSPQAPSPSRERPSAVRARALYLVTGALSGVPVLVGQLAGPSFSYLSEAAVLSALLIGAALGGGVLALAQGAAARAPDASWWERWPALALWVAAVAMIEAFGVLWLGAAFRILGLSVDLGMACALGFPAVAAALAASGPRWGLALLAAGALTCWAVFLGGFPWFHAVAYPGASSVLGVGPQALQYPAAQLHVIFAQRWWDDVAMAAAGTLLLAPWLWVARGQPGAAPSRSGGGGWGRWLVPTLVLVSFVLMALGTQSFGLDLLAGGLIAQTATWLRWMGLAAWLLGSTAAFAVAWTGVAERLAGVWSRLAAIVLTSGLAAGIAFAILAPLTLPRFTAQVTALPFLNAEAGLLAIPYIVAPVLGVAAAVAILRWRGRRVPSTAWGFWAWLVGLLAAVLGARGFDRWAAGPVLHRVLPGVPAHFGLGWFWITTHGGVPDWGLAAGVLVGAVVTVFGAARRARRSILPSAEASSRR